MQIYAFSGLYYCFALLTSPIWDFVHVCTVCRIVAPRFSLPFLACGRRSRRKWLPSGERPQASRWEERVRARVCEREGARDVFLILPFQYGEMF